MKKIRQDGFNIYQDELGICRRLKMCNKGPNYQLWSHVGQKGREEYQYSDYEN